jgi:hypothetical protein
MSIYDKPMLTYTFGDLVDHIVAKLDLENPDVISEEFLQQAKHWVIKDFTYEYVSEQIDQILDYRMGKEISQLRKEKA